MNAFGEEPGLGPEWACENYGQQGHNYITCKQCLQNFMSRGGTN